MKTDFREKVISGMTKDFNEIFVELATFIDQQVIDRKFQENFPGHELSERTKKRKGHGQIGVDTGKLRSAATLVTNWSVFPCIPGTFRPALKKTKRGLTAYAETVKTKIGGYLDFLNYTSKDIVNLERKLQQFLKNRNYSGTGKIRVIRR